MASCQLFLLDVTNWLPAADFYLAATYECPQLKCVRHLIIHKT